METLLHVLFILVALTALVLFTYTYLINRKEKTKKIGNLNKTRSAAKPTKAFQEKIEYLKKVAPLDEQAYMNKGVYQEDIKTRNEFEPKSNLIYLYLLPTIPLGGFISIYLNGIEILNNLPFLIGNLSAFVIPAIFVSLIVSLFLRLFGNEFPRKFFIVFTYILLLATFIFVIIGHEYAKSYINTSF